MRTPAPKDVDHVPSKPFFATENQHTFFPSASAPRSSFFRPSILQAKLTVGNPGDRYEQEADNVSNQIEGKISATSGAGTVQREFVCEDEDMVQQKSFASKLPPFSADAARSGSDARVPQTDDAFESVLNREKGKGQAIPQSTQDSMEHAFGRDFSNVKIHTNETSAHLNKRIRSHAFTSGSDIFFNQNRFRPNTDKGRKLLSHELTHVVQQGKAGKKTPSAPPASVQAFRAQHSKESIINTQHQMLGPTAGFHTDQSNRIRRCPAGCSSPKTTFNPSIGTKKTSLKGTYGDFEVEHGLQKKPTTADFGEYFLKIEMTPNAKTGTSKIGFVQTSRQGLEGGGWATKATDKYMTANKAERTEAVSGWRVDRADYKGDKTPFYGMYKDSGGAIKQYSTSRVGEHGGAKAMLKDVPGVALVDHMQFTATAMDMSTGTEYGSIAWGYEYNEGKNVYNEETPFLAAAGSERMKGRDRAITKWNTDIAKPGSGVDKVPGKP